MAEITAGASAFGSGAMVAVKAVPPPAWVLLALVAGVGILLFHQYANTPDDVSWTNPEQPPDNLPVGMTVPPAVAGAEHGTHAMRARQARRFTLWPGDTGPAAGAWSPIPTSGRPDACTWGGIF